MCLLMLYCYSSANRSISSKPKILVYKCLKRLKTVLIVVISLKLKYALSHNIIESEATSLVGKRALIAKILVNAVVAVHYIGEQLVKSVFVVHLASQC